MRELWADKFGGGLRLMILFLLLWGLFFFVVGEYELVGQRVRSVSQEGEAQDSGFFSQVSRLGECVLEKVTWEGDGYSFVVYPSGGYSPRNGLEIGVMPALKWLSGIPGRANTLTFGIEGSSEGMLQLQAEYEWFVHPRWQSRGEMTCTRRNDRFWPSDKTDNITFSRRGFLIQGELLRFIAPKLWGGFMLFGSVDSFSDVKMTTGAEDDVYGFDGGSVFGCGPVMVFDSRNRVLAPNQGALFRTQYLFIGAVGLGNYSYGQWTLDARYYTAVNEFKGVLAAQVLFELAEDGVPFCFEPGLGGKDRLRGIGHPLRYTDKAMWMTRFEYRQPLWWRLGGVAFGGVGKVAPDFTKPFSRVVGSFGGGLRFRMLPHDPLNVRVDLGFSTTGDSGFFISLKEAF